MTTLRVHSTNTPLAELCDVAQSGEFRAGAGKPEGLWYAINDSWLEWCRTETEWKYALHYALELREDARLLILPTAESVLRFSRDYCADEALIGLSLRAIDWQRVMGEYDGIEIAPYQWPLRLHQETFWYYSWDVASGCIWRPSRAVASFQEIAREAIPACASEDDE